MERTENKGNGSSIQSTDTEKRTKPRSTRSTNSPDCSRGVGQSRDTRAGQCEGAVAGDFSEPRTQTARKHVPAETQKQNKSLTGEELSANFPTEKTRSKQTPAFKLWNG